MTAVEHHAPPDTLTVAQILAKLPEALHDAFHADLGDAVDEALAAGTGDFAPIERVKTGWWGRALIETSPQLQADLDALERGDLELFPSPFLR